MSASASDDIQLAYHVTGIPERGDLTSEFAWTDALADIQGMLSELGFYNGAIDGRLTRATRNAIEGYRRRYGVIDDETTWPAMLVHMRAIGEAMRLQASLKEARQRQIEQAEERLRRHEGSRALIVGRIERETADPTRDPRICFAAPTLRCLLDEALEDTRGVSREKYRNWALQDLIGTFARAGMLDPMKDAVRRLSDARLVLVALRDASTAMSAAGRFALAEETIALMPEGRDRLRALSQLAGQLLTRREPGAAREAADRLSDEIRGLGDAEERAQAAAEAAATFARYDAVDLARRLIEAGGDSLKPRGEVSRSAVAVAYAALDERDKAEAMIGRIEKPVHRRPALIALTAAFARAGSLDDALRTAASIDEARYRVVALCDAARTLERAGLLEEAARAVRSGIGHLSEVEGEFATDFAWSCLAEVHAVLGEDGKADDAARQIEGADLRARTLWRIVAHARAAGDAVRAQRFQDAAALATEGVDTFKRVSILSDVAATFAGNGRIAEARAFVDQALSIVSDIRTRWWRARALCRVATAMIAIESAGSAR